MKTNSLPQLLKEINSFDELLAKRLADLGFYPGLEVKVIQKVSFGKVFILQINQSLVALNENEFLCLKF